jgi:hypothetical protein
MTIEKPTMVFIALSAFFPEPNLDTSLQYQNDVAQDLEMEVLNVMGWTSLKDVPMGEHELTAEQSRAVMNIVGSPYKENLMYYLGLCSQD